MKTFDDLFAELSAKAVERPAGSGTVAQLDAGVHAIGKKIVEEAAEVWMAAEYESDEAAAEEIFWAGILSVPKGQAEAARSTGLSWLQSMVFVVMPQAFRLTVAPLTSTPPTRTAPPITSPRLGASPRSSAAEAIATTGASRIQGTTAADGLRPSSPLKTAYANSVHRPAV